MQYTTNPHKSMYTQQTEISNMEVNSYACKSYFQEQNTRTGNKETLPKWTKTNHAQSEQKIAYRLVIFHRIVEGGTADLITSSSSLFNIFSIFGVSFFQWFDIRGTFFLWSLSESGSGKRKKSTFFSILYLMPIESYLQFIISSTQF